MIISRTLFIPILVTSMLSSSNLSAMHQAPEIYHNIQIPHNPFKLTDAENLVISINELLYNNYLPNKITEELYTALEKEKISLCDIKSTSNQATSLILALNLFYRGYIHPQVPLILIDVAIKLDVADDLFNFKNMGHQETALHVAVYTGQTNVVTSIIHATKNLWMLLKKQDRNGWTALHHAIEVCCNATVAHAPIECKPADIKIAETLLSSAGNYAWKYICIKGDCGSALDLLNSQPLINPVVLFSQSTANDNRKKLIQLFESYRPKASL